MIELDLATYQLRRDGVSVPVEPQVIDLIAYLVPCKDSCSWKICHEHESSSCPELSALTRQCLAGRRIGELQQLQAEVAAWSEQTNATQRGVDWQFKVDDARCKLKHLYPKIKTR